MLCRVLRLWSMSKQEQTTWRNVYYKQWLRELELFSLEKRRLRDYLITHYHPLKGNCQEVGLGSFSQVTSRKSRRSGLQLHQGRFRLDVRKNFFIKRVVKHWNRQPRNWWVETPSLEVFQRMDVALKDMVYWWHCLCWVNRQT